MNDGTIIIGQNAEGSYVILSRAAPYFCFEGQSEAEVIAKLKSALAFYAEYQKKRRAVKLVNHTTTIAKYTARRFVQPEEVAYA